MKTKIVLGIFGGAILLAGVVIGSVTAFISPRLVGSIGVANSEEGDNMYISLDSEKDYERLKKYSYVVLRSNEYTHN